MSRSIVGAAVAFAALLTAAPSALAAGSVFGGSTRAGEPIVLTADRATKTLKSAVVVVRAKCSNGRGFPLSGNLTAVKRSPGFTPGPYDLVVTRNAKGRFAGKVHAAEDLGDLMALATTTLSGKLSAKRATGWLQLDISILDKQTMAETVSCHSGAVRWEASRSPGRIYGGSSSQQEPVVVRLDAKRKTVTDVLAGWESSTCTPDGFMRYGEHFTNFPLHAGGFGNTWDEMYDGDAGSKMRYAYVLAGKVTRRSASGTLHVGVTGTDAGGATTLTCDTGSVTWKATSG
jgi:hypothetical protein